MEKLEPLYLASRSVKWCSHCGKQFGYSSEHYRITCDPVISLLEYSQKNYKQNL